MINARLDVVLIFAPVDVEALLIGLVSDAVPDSAPEHHLAALHVIVHDVLQFWNQGLFVDEVKVDQIVGRNLNSNVALDVVKEASRLYCMVANPLGPLEHQIVLLLEKQDFAGRPRDQGFPIEHHHLAEVSLQDFLSAKHPRPLYVDDKGVAISVERVDLVLLDTEEALVWEVLDASLDSVLEEVFGLETARWAPDLPVRKIPDEMVMSVRVVMEQIYEDFVVGNECAGHERV
jgi:hypothetical protein